MRVFDCFTFFNEIDLLKIRCEILKPLNPIHILVEAGSTHTGDNKPFHFLRNIKSFDEYNIRSIGIELPNDGNPWHNENVQRDGISELLYDLEDDDLVIISDLDEIPNPEVIMQFEPDKMVIAALKMDKFSYYLNCLEATQAWESAKLTTGKYMKTTTPQQVREGGFKTIMLDAGWHWSWLGGIDKIMEKFWAFAHQENNNSKFANPEILKHKLENNISMWGEDHWKIIPIDDYFPKYIQDHKQLLIEKGLIKPLLNEKDSN